MKTFLMVFFISLLLGAAFAGSSYFVTKEQDIVFKCQIDTTAAQPQQYNTYKQTDNGFPFAFFTKYSAPKKDGCQKPDTPSIGQVYDAQDNLLASSKSTKVNFGKDFAIYSAGFLVLGIMLFGVKKKQ
jgi:hypothetical protein